ncbi:MAG TPA: hypothetical protein G4O04_04400 [Anaerolineae bacterium]|nr:hypothetical protein [Anaerolineae bacterium]HID84266.1 hypothetical protein [Anaerolineales bacterium]
MSKQKNNPKIHTEGGAYVGGEVHTGGDFVGRDKIVQAGERGTAIGGNVSGSTIITGDGNVVNAAALEAVFAPVYAAIQDSPRPVVEKEDLTAEVRDIQQVVAHPKVEASWLGRRLRNLKRMAPDIAEVLLAGLTGPQAVVSETVRKIATKARSEA